MTLFNINEPICEELNKNEFICGGLIIEGIYIGFEAGVKLTLTNLIFFIVDDELSLFYGLLLTTFVCSIVGA